METPQAVTSAVDAVTTMLASTANDIIQATTTTMTMTSGVQQTTEGVHGLTMEPSGKPTSEHLHFAMSAVVGPIICLLGMLGNILAIIVWNRPGMTSSTGRYLTAQAVADFGVLLFFILVDSSQAWNPDLVNQPSYGGFFCYIGYPLFFFFIIASIWMTVGVTIDRYILVCWIAKAKEFCNPKRANFGIFLISINCFLINIPHYMSFRTVTPDANSTSQATFEPTEFETGSGGQFYEFWIHCIVLILIPWFSVFTMNMGIIKQIGRSNQKMADKKSGQSLKKAKKSENQITRLLLGVTFSFLFFIGIQCIVQCLWMQKPEGANMELVSSSFAFAKTGIVFNSSLNFVFYCLMGRRFRIELKSLLRIRTSKDFQLSSLTDGTSSSGTTSGTTSTTGM